MQLARYYGYCAVWQGKELHGRGRRLQVKIITTIVMVVLLAIGVSLASEEEDSLLHAALGRHDYDTALTLLRSGTVKVDAKAPNGDTPLCTAAGDPGADAYDMAHVLLKLGADANAVCADGWTALGAAAYVGNLAVVDLLVKYGAEASLDDRPLQGQPLFAAYQGGDRRVAERLESLGAEPLPPDVKSELKKQGAFKQAALASLDEPLPEVELDHRELELFYQAALESFGADHIVTAAAAEMLRQVREDPSLQGVPLEQLVGPAMDALARAEGMFRKDGTKR